MNNTQNTILNTITELFNSMFSSIDNSIYSALDEISFIDSNILNSPYLEKLLGSNSVSGILIIANSLLIGFILFFTIRYLLSNFSIVQSQNPYQFFIKVIFVGILMNSSFFICQQIINLNSLISSSIRDIR